MHINEFLPATIHAPAAIILVTRILTAANGDAALRRTNNQSQRCSAKDNIPACIPVINNSKYNNRGLTFNCSHLLHVRLKIIIIDLSSISSIFDRGGPNKRTPLYI